MTREHDRYREDLAPYALGALTELESAALERHVAGCEECARELDALRITVDALPAAVPQHAAPASLKASLIETVRAEAAAGGREQDAPARPRRSRWRLPIALPRPALALAGATAIAVASVAGYAALEEDPPGGETIAASVDRARVPAAQATLEARGDVGVLRVSGLPQLTGERRYVVWVDRGDGPVYATSFNVRPDGSATAGVANVDEAEAVMVTRERSTAVDAPSEPPVITVARG